MANTLNPWGLVSKTCGNTILRIGGLKVLQRLGHAIGETMK